jgi:hypothetical protein
LTSIAEKVNATFVHSISLRRYYDHAGNSVKDSTCGFIYEKVFTYNHAASVYSREHKVEKEKSVLEFCRKQLDEDEDVDTDEKRELVGSGVEMLAGISACDLEKLSLKYYWMEDDLPVPLSKE